MTIEIPPPIELAILGLSEDTRTGYWDTQSWMDLKNLLDWVIELPNRGD